MRILCLWFEGMGSWFCKFIVRGGQKGVVNGSSWSMDSGQVNEASWL